MSLAAWEFIRRFLLHVLPKGFCKIRYYGIFALRNRKEMLLRCKQTLAYSTQKSKLTGLSWQDALKTITGIDVCKCPVCKTGNMLTTVILTRYRAPWWSKYLIFRSLTNLKIDFFCRKMRTGIAMPLLKIFLLRSTYDKAFRNDFNF